MSIGRDAAGDPKLIGEHACFDGMSWPGYWDNLDIEYRLRHDPESITREDHMHAASVLAAYRELITCTSAKRAKVVREILKLGATRP